jgi:hypothetical protein
MSNSNTPVILTEKRREVLDNYDPDNDAERNRVYQTKKRAQTVIAELIDIAEGDSIENEDVFEPEEIRLLIQAILGDPFEIEPPRWESDHAGEHYREFAYEHAMTSSIETAIDDYLVRLNWETEPPDMMAPGTPGGGVAPSRGFESEYTEK